MQRSHFTKVVSNVSFLSRVAITTSGLVLQVSRWSIQKIVKKIIIPQHRPFLSGKKINPCY